MDNETLPYALAVIKLFQGVVNNDDKAAWNCLIQYQQEIKLFFSGIGIEVFVQENEGFAFLRQRVRDSDQDDSLPSLLRKDQLTYPVTLLSVLLYEKLIELIIQLPEIKEIKKDDTLDGLKCQLIESGERVNITNHTLVE